MSRLLSFILIISCLIFFGCKESCDDGILNQDETFVDCGGTCPTCETCVDGIQNGLELGVDCGGSCQPCISCFDGVLNQGELGIDCGGPCDPCETCFDGILNQNEVETDCGGVCLPCLAFCPSTYGTPISGNLSFSNSPESNTLVNAEYDLLFTGIQFSFLFTDSTIVEFYHDYTLFEEGSHNSSPLTTIEFQGSDNNHYSSFNPESSIFFFLNQISTDASCRIILGNLNSNITSDDGENFAFINIQFDNFQY